MSRTSRIFRIFVSSTFSDFVEERSALQKWVFPRLAELAKKHDCRFQAIDLRWGVSTEAALDQQTMRICLEEIQRCQNVSPRPNFIMLLGDRYGWRPLPESIPAEEFILLQSSRPFQDPSLLQLFNKWYVLDKNADKPEYILQPRKTGTEFAQFKIWEKKVERPLVRAFEKAAPLITNDKAREKYILSATGQEIFGGGLSMDDANEHVFAYFRRISKRKTVLASPKGISYFDHLGKSPNQRLCNQQKALKTRVKLRLEGHCHKFSAVFLNNTLNTGHIGRLPDNLPDCLSLKDSETRPMKLCKAVWLDLSRIMLAEIAAMDAPDSPDTEQLVHRKYVGQVSATFTGRTREKKEIIDYCAAPQTAPMIVWGEAGVGKSALLAKAVQQLEDKQIAGAVIISRFIGVTAPSSNASSLLESLSRQVDIAYGVDQKNVPLDYPALVQGFWRTLGLSSAEHPLFLFLDGLDQLSVPEAPDQASSLAWLPVRLPPHTHLVASIASGKSLDFIRARLAHDDAILQVSVGLPEFLELGKLTADEGSKLLDSWLDAAHRRLTTPQRQTVLDAFASSGSPQFLRLAFEEARRWKSYTPFPSLPNTISDLTLSVVDRLSQPQNHGKELVAHTIGYLAAARHGLAEDEILDILSQDTEVMKKLREHSKDSPKFQKIPVAIWVRLLSDLQPYLFECASNGLALMRWRAAFPPEGLGQEQARTALARYFKHQPHGHRRTDELPWLMESMHNWSDLENLLNNEIFFNLGWQHSRHDIRAYWRELELRGGNSVKKAYRTFFDHPGQNPELTWNVAELLLELGELEHASKLLVYLDQFYRHLLDQKRLAAVLQNLANAFYLKNNLDQSMQLYGEVESIGVELKAPEIIQAACGGQAGVLSARNRPDLARLLRLRQEKLCRECGNQPGLQSALGALIQIDMDNGQLKSAMARLDELEQLCELLGNWDGLQAAWGNRGCIYESQEKWEPAIEFFNKQYQLCVQTGNFYGEAAALIDLSVLYQQDAKADYPRAFALLTLAEQVCQDTQFPKTLITAWINQAGMLAFNFGNPELGLEKAAHARESAAQHGFTDLETQAQYVFELIQQEIAVPPPSGNY